MQPLAIVTTQLLQEIPAYKSYPNKNFYKKVKLHYGQFVLKRWPFNNIEIQQCLQNCKCSVHISPDLVYHVSSVLVLLDIYLLQLCDGELLLEPVTMQQWIRLFIQYVSTSPLFLFFPSPLVASAVAALPSPLVCVSPHQPRSHII